MNETPMDPGYTQEILDELKREGSIVYKTDAQGNVIYRGGQPVFILSPLGLNKFAGQRGLN